MNHFTLREAVYSTCIDTGADPREMFIRVLCDMQGMTVGEAETVWAEWELR